MPQELVPESSTFAGTFDESRNVGDHELRFLTQTHHAKVGFQRGEGIVRDLRLGGRHRRDEGALAGVRIPNECDIGHQLELELEPSRRTVLALFGKLRRATLVGEEPCIAATALTAGNGHPSHAMRAQVGKYFATVEVAHDGALRHLYFQVFSASSVEILPHSRHTVFATTMRMITERHQGRHVVVGDQPYRTTVATVATVRTAVHHRTFAAETHATRATVATTHVQLRFVNKRTHVG